MNSIEHNVEHELKTIEHKLVTMIESVGSDENSADARIAELERENKIRNVDELQQMIDLTELDKYMNGGFITVLALFDLFFIRNAIWNYTEFPIIENAD